MKRKGQKGDQTDQAIRRMTRWVDNVLGQMHQKFCPVESWTPSVNLYESSNDYHIVVDLAGVQSDQIDLVVEQNVLTISGERPCPRHPVKGDCRMRLMEIDHGPFCRKVQLPGDVDVDAIDARYRGGLLTIDLPKKA
jgi:HSP20 family protein